MTEEACDRFAYALIWCLVAVVLAGVYVMGVLTGRKEGVHAVKLEAVAYGVAEFYVDDNGNPVCRWKRKAEAE